MRKAFTLIELLIVIAIIGILMSLLFPAASSAIDAARKAQAKNDVTQIAAAVVAYEAEYGKLPLPAKTTVDTELVNVLAGIDTNSTNNPRGLVFLEVSAAKKGKSGTNEKGFVDPWANIYQIVMDDNYDNSVTAKGINLRKKVAVWNAPTGTSSNRRSVTSWE